jgi:hypothetical protein
MYSNNTRSLRTLVIKYVWLWQNFIAAHVVSENFIRKTETSIQLHKVCNMLHTVSRKSCFQFRDYAGNFIIKEQGGHRPSQNEKEYRQWQATLTAQAHRLYWLYSCMMWYSHDNECEPLGHVIQCYAITAIKIALWRTRFRSFRGGKLWFIWIFWSTSQLPTPLETEILVKFKNAVPTAHKPRCVFTTKVNNYVL